MTRKMSIPDTWTCLRLVWSVHDERRPRKSRFECGARWRSRCRARLGRPDLDAIFWQLAYQIDSGRLLPGARLLPVRELGAALRVNPNTIRAVYRRLSDAGYVTSRHGAGTHVTERPPQRRGTEKLAGIIAETLRRAAHAGFTADEVAAATFAAATERKRPGPLRPGALRGVHQRRCRL